MEARNDCNEGQQISRGDVCDASHPQGRSDARQATATPKGRPQVATGLRMKSCPPVETGDRLELIACTHLYEHIDPGTTGTVKEVKAHGVIVVVWDDGSERWLVPGEDEWRKTS